MYFAILGKNPQISIEELNLLCPTINKIINNQIILFDAINIEKIETLGGIIKRGEVINKDELKVKLAETKLIGVSNEKFGLQLKRNFGIRRYKTVNLFHTDIEIKKKGLEIVEIGNLTGVVKGYQNIKLYESIDFEKPARSMQMGMMPAKLTHIMINIGLKHITEQDIFIYDPFAGSMTTGFIANFMGYDFIGSDIESKYADKNLERRKNNIFFNPNKKIIFFQQDIRNHLEQKKFDNLFPNLIITEGWLGPIVRKDENNIGLQKIQDQTYELYKTFISQIHSFYKTNNQKLPIMVFTIPIYKGKNEIEEKIKKTCTDNKSRSVDSIEEVYKRPEQNIGRKILILS